MLWENVSENFSNSALLYCKCWFWPTSESTLCCNCEEKAPAVKSCLTLRSGKKKFQRKYYILWRLKAQLVNSSWLWYCFKLLQVLVNSSNTGVNGLPNTVVMNRKYGNKIKNIVLLGPVFIFFLIKAEPNISWLDIKCPTD